MLIMIAELKWLSFNNQLAFIGKLIGVVLVVSATAIS